MNYVFTGCFTVEAVMRLYAMGFAVSSIGNGFSHPEPFLEVFIDPPAGPPERACIV